MTTQIQKELLQDASISTAKFDASAKAPFATNTVAVSFGQHASALAQGATTDGTNGTPRTAAETRPKNIALLACIKF